MLRALLRLFLPSKGRTKQLPTQLNFTPSTFVAPTQKQLDYAELCGVEVQPQMDRQAVSDAIDAAFKADPKLNFKVNARRKRAAKKSRESLQAMPADIQKQHDKWSNIAGDHDHFVVAYKESETIVVDILECENVKVVENDVLIGFLAPRIEDAVVGSIGDEQIREKELRWDQKLSISVTDIIESRKIEIYDDQVKKYRSTIARKMKKLAE